MSNSVYYKATDEDGNTVLRHSWKKHKYLYIKMVSMSTQKTLKNRLFHTKAQHQQCRHRKLSMRRISRNVLEL